MESHEEKDWNQQITYVLSFKCQHEALSSEEQRLQLTEGGCC